MATQWLHAAVLSSAIATISPFCISLSAQTLSEFAPPANVGAPVNTIANDV